MGDIPDINLADPTVEPTDKQLQRIGKMLKEGITPLPEGVTLPPLVPTPAVVWNKKMKKAMEDAKRVYAKITGSNTGDSGRA